MVGFLGELFECICLYVLACLNHYPPFQLSQKPLNFHNILDISLCNPASTTTSYVPEWQRSIKLCITCSPCSSRAVSNSARDFGNENTTCVSFFFFQQKHSRAHSSTNRGMTSYTPDKTPEEAKNIVNLFFFFFFTRVLQNSLYISIYMRYVHLCQCPSVFFFFPSSMGNWILSNHETFTTTPGNAPKELGLYTQHYV